MQKMASAIMFGAFFPAAHMSKHFAKPTHSILAPGRRALCLFALAALGWSSRMHAQSGSQIVVGIVPYLSARRLVELYEPLRALLAQVLARPVVLETASDYREFLSRTALGRYDLIATSPYFGRLAQLEQGYVPLARPLTDLEPLLVVQRNGGPATLPELRGRVITTSDALANLTLSAMRYLSAHGLVPGRDIEVRATGSHANSLAALERGDSVAAVVSTSALTQVGGDWTNRVQVLARMEAVTPLLYLVHQRTSEADQNRLRLAMLTFANDTPAGKQFSANLGHGGLRPIRVQDMSTLDSFVEELKNQLKADKH